jgi:hypothetical protein
MMISFSIIGTPLELKTTSPFIFFSTSESKFLLGTFFCPTIEDGKEQLARYLDRLGLNGGYLVIFDPGDREWEEKIYMKEIDFNDKAIIMVGV